MQDYEIVKNNDFETKKKYGLWHGFDDIELTQEHLQALLEGKCVACNCEEYAFFITLKR